MPSGRFDFIEIETTQGSPDDCRYTDASLDQPLSTGAAFSDPTLFGFTSCKE